MTDREKILHDALTIIAGKRKSYLWAIAAEALAQFAALPETPGLSDVAAHIRSEADEYNLMGYKGIAEAFEKLAKGIEKPKAALQSLADKLTKGEK